MRKKIWLIILAIVVLLTLAAAVLSAKRSVPPDGARDMLNRVENALGEEWKKQTVTEVFDLTYADDDGNTIIYYICFTTYYEADAGDTDGLNTDAIAPVINPSEAESCRACTLGDLPAAIYRKDGRAYFCWTIMPELSCVIKYDPAAVSGADILRMAESVPVNTIHSTDP